MYAARNKRKSLIAKAYYQCKEGIAERQPALPTCNEDNYLSPPYYMGLAFNP
jgi:hypothetical protein